MDVRISKQAQKQLRKVPDYVADKLEDWVLAVREFGLNEIQKVKGFHDEPLKGKKFGRRSIRLSRKWRAEYTIDKEKQAQILIDFIEIQEVHPHDY